MLSAPHTPARHAMALAAAAALLLAAASCTEEGGAAADLGTSPDTARAMGTEGGACYPNGTCNAGLSCYSNLCVRVTSDGSPGPDTKRWPDTSGRSDGPVVAPDHGASPDSQSWPCTKDTQCDDKVACTVDKCTSSGCTNTLKSGFCLINKVCFPDGVADPSDHCNRCHVTQSVSVWTPVAAKGCVTTYAGTGAPGYLDGQHDAAKFNNLSGVALDPTSGAIYLADRKNHRVRKLAGGVVSTLAGTGTAGFLDGATAVAQFNDPYALAVSGPRVFVADRANHRVRIVQAGVVSTLAGSGQQGFLNGAAAQAKFSYPTGVAVDGKGNVYIADRSNHRVRKFYGGQVTTHAGTGAAGMVNGAAGQAKFNLPSGVAADSAGNVYVADTGNKLIRVIAQGQVSTVVGGTGVSMTGPEGVAIDPQGAIFIADTKAYAVLKLAAGKLTTLAGSGKVGFADGAAAKAMFGYPQSVVADSKGRVFVADAHNHRLRLITQ